MSNTKFFFSNDYWEDKEEKYITIFKIDNECEGSYMENNEHFIKCNVDKFNINWRGGCLEEVKTFKFYYKILKNYKNKYPIVYACKAWYY